EPVWGRSNGEIESQKNTKISVRQPLPVLSASRAKVVQQSDTVTARARFKPPERLERVKIRFSTPQRVEVGGIPKVSSLYQGQIAGLTESFDTVIYTLDAELQKYTEQLVKQSASPHVAMVVMDPRTGHVLAVADRSSSIKNLYLHTGFPAASLFKIVTTTAALELTDISPMEKIRFRGGTYTLNQWNYRPDRRRDNQVMTLTEALGKSCNPVFARVALGNLDQQVLQSYASSFGFNEVLPYDEPLELSRANIPANDFGLARTAAGFGDVYFSPIHAASMMAGIANNGRMPRPVLVDRIVGPDGMLKYRAYPRYSDPIMQSSTARTLLNMLEATTTTGTSKKEFFVGSRPRLPGVRVAAKTGTLSGISPKGINRWFVATAPIQNPQVVVVVLNVDNQRRAMSSSRMGRMLLEHFFRKGKVVS
ncbi:MAG: hypothetical protein KDD53_08675, partial [Bdellovibrionales bacterium]|nr:hypothetical protein [Bdellovibrionales bacterium]